MKKQLIIFVLFVSPFFIASRVLAVTPQIIGPDMQIVNNNIIINLRIVNVKELETPIISGIDKEINFTVELLRAWRFWPDEFVVSKKIAKVVMYDNLRERFRTSSYDGVSRSENLFKDYNAMKDWIFTVNGVNLANIKELEPGTYYIRIVVESRSLEQLPLIGIFMHLIPEVEMSLAKESDPFIVNNNQ